MAVTATRNVLTQYFLGSFLPPSASLVKKKIIVLVWREITVFLWMKSESEHNDATFSCNINLKPFQQINKLLLT
jgi:hypothetical protein